MSHLSTIIWRVKHRLEVCKTPEQAGSNPLFVQAVNNLVEYQESWDDFTKQEADEANELYAKYINYCK